MTINHYFKHIKRVKTIQSIVTKGACKRTLIVDMFNNTALEYVPGCEGFTNWLAGNYKLKNKDDYNKTKL